MSLFAISMLAASAFALDGGQVKIGDKAVMDVSFATGAVTKGSGDTKTFEMYIAASVAMQGDYTIKYNQPAYAYICTGGKADDSKYCFEIKYEARQDADSYRMKMVKYSVLNADSVIDAEKAKLYTSPGEYWTKAVPKATVRNGELEADFKDGAWKA